MTCGEFPATAPLRCSRRIRAATRRGFATGLSRSARSRASAPRAHSSRTTSAAPQSSRWRPRHVSPGRLAIAAGLNSDVERRVRESGAYTRRDMTVDRTRQRAQMPAGAAGILDARSLAASHRRLRDLIAPGLRILDVGCGTGAITRGAAEATGDNGRVVGVDIDAALLAKARAQHANCRNLLFVRADIYSLPSGPQFDIVTAARVLQWVSQPPRALQAMRQACRAGGRVLVLDYNHERIEWTPAPPDSVKTFYAAFLRWRADAGMDNSIATHLPQLFETAGLTNVTVTEQHERTERGAPDFETRVGIWADVAASRGHQMVIDGVLTEAQRSAAELDYRDWIVSAQAQQLYLLAVEGAVTATLP
jgi:ubiquinone/menaquinone biosynthesis C-methylase UbiE